ncbi:MAG: DHA2 family efflux MFS transporter permease subunit [Solirubrobacterales bacterium]
MHLGKRSNHPHPLDRRTLVVCAVVMIGGVMSILDMTVVNVALDRLTVEFDASFSTVQWVVTGYTLALAAVIPVTGWASDRFGMKRIYIGAVAAFTLGSVLCALAWSLGSLIAFRVLQGAGGGMVLPVITTIVTRQAGPHRRGRVMGILGVPLLAAPVFGPILGGWLVDAVSWRAVFLINLPVGLVAMALAQVVLDRDRPQPGHRLDWLGMALLSPGLTLMIFGFAESPAHGFGAVRTWLPILIGAALIAAFLVHSWRSPVPLIDVRTFVHTRAGAAAATVLLLSAGLFGVLLMVPVYFQVARGTSALESGLLLAPQGVGAMVAMPIAGWLADRHGPFWLPACGVPFAIVGTVPFTLLTATTPFALLCAFNVLVGFGLGIAFMPAMTAAMNSVPERAIARTSTAMNILDQAGASIGAAVLSVVLAAALPQAMGAGGIDAVSGLGDGRRAALAAPLADAFSTVFTWALAGLIASMVPALLLARHRRGARLPVGQGPQLAERA